jgi:glycosyltransferase involved in cell wall biosynthesis
MKVWLITSGEPLPMYGEKPHRTGSLARLLAEQGHEVTWWTTTFDHQSKSYLHSRDAEAQASDRITMVFLHSAVAYTRNISVRRLINHWQVAQRFKALAQIHPRPDVVVCSFPTIDLAHAAVEFAEPRQVPVFVDVRDLWPDIFVDVFRKVWRPLIRLALLPYFWRTRRVLRDCDGLLAVSRGYLQWALSYAARPQRDFDAVFPLAVDRHDIPGEDVSAQATILKRQGLNPHRTIVWYVGTFGRSYDLGTVIDAAKRLKDRQDLQFVFTGDGERRQEWERLAAGADNILFTGWLSKAGVAYLSSIAQIGLLAYAEGAPQGLPNKLFEYMAAGVPALSSLRGECAELLLSERIGLSYEPGGVESLENALRGWADNPEDRRVAGRRARRLFEARFSGAVVYRNYVEHIEQVSKTIHAASLSALRTGI